MKILRRKPINPGTIKTIQVPENGWETRAPKDLELVWVSDDNEAPYGPGLKGLGLEGVSPVHVLGVREIESTSQPSMWRDGYLIIMPEQKRLFTSPVASKYMPECIYEHLFDNIQNADDVMRLREGLAKKGFVH